jgi:hypothetical protein
VQEHNQVHPLFTSTVLSQTFSRHLPRQHRIRQIFSSRITTTSSPTMASENKVASMPYNTRRKSLSLPSLGIHLPVTHASRAAARLSPPSTGPDSENPPTKKIKRSHEDSPSMSPPPKRAPIKYEHTPPPSPEAETDDLDEDVKPREIDLAAIGDDIVEGVIIQLQKTGNRPHLVKELAAILSQSVKIVEQ